MATATLHGAKTYCYGGIVFAANEPVVVADKMAEELSHLPQYFTVVVDGRKPSARRIPKAESPAEPTESF